MAQYQLPSLVHPDFSSFGRKPQGPVRVKPEFADRLAYLHMLQGTGDIISNQNGALVNAGISVDRMHGQIMDLNGANAYLDSGFNPSFNAVTFFVITKPSDVGFGIIANRTGTSTGFDITVEGASSGLVRARFEESSGSANAQPQFTMDASDRDDWVCVFATHDPNADARILAYTARGKLYSAAVGAGIVGPMLTGSQNLRFGRRGSSYSNNQLALGGFYNKAMTLDEMEHHARAFLRYEMLEPAVPLVYNTGVSGPTLQDLSPTGLVSGEAFGSHTVATSAQDITPTGIGTAESFGNAELDLVLDLTGIVSGEAFGTASLSLALLPASIASAEAFGTATIGLDIAPSAISGEEVFGSHVIGFGLGVAPAGIASAENFGTAVVGGIYDLAPTAILTGENFGGTIVSDVQPITATGITTGENMPSPTVQSTADIQAPSANSGETFGSASLLGANTITTVSIASAEAVGTPELDVVNTITFTGIASGEIVTDPVVLVGDINILPSGITSGEAVNEAPIDTFEETNQGKVFKVRKRRHY